MVKLGLLSAGIVRDLRFASEGDLHEYMDKRLSNGSSADQVVLLMEIPGDLRR